MLTSLLLLLQLVTMIYQHAKHSVIMTDVMEAIIKVMQRIADKLTKTHKLSPMQTAICYAGAVHDAAGLQLETGCADVFPAGTESCRTACFLTAAGLQAGSQFVLGRLCMQAVHTASTGCLQEVRVGQDSTGCLQEVGVG